MFTRDVELREHGKLVPIKFLCTYMVQIYIYFIDNQSSKSRLAGFHKETSYMCIYKDRKLYNCVIINIYIYRYDDCTFILEFTI